MATLDRFYAGKSDTDLAKEDLLNSGDVLIQLLEYEGTATLDSSTPASSTFTVSTTDWSADKFNSTGANLVFLDDNSLPWKVPIDDTVQNSTTGVITFDITAAVKEVDGTTDAESSLTTGNTFSIYIWTPTTTADEYSGVYGRYLGWQSALTTNLADEFAKIEIDIPRELKDKGLIRRTVTVNGTSKMAANIETLKLLGGGVEYGSQSSKTSWAVGFKPAAQTKVKLYIVSEDRNGRRISDTYLRGTMSYSGEQDRMAEEFKSITWMFEAEADGFYPDNANAILTSRDDS